MSDSEAGGVMTSVGEQKSSVQSQPIVHNMRLAFSPEGTAVYKPVTSTTTSPTLSSYHSTAPAAEGSVAAGGPVLGGTKSGSATDLKRKRGRPRKYGPDGSMSLAIIPSPGTHSSGNGGGGGASSPPPPPPAGGKARGRPPGSSKKLQLEILGSSGLGFTPHIIIVKAGEDVCSKIMAFSQQGPRAIVILSAIGTISNVTLRQQTTSGGTVTYEGRFEILTLSGSFTLSENGGHRSRTGGLSVSLSSPDGRILGGGVAGLLTAASPVQIVVASFIADGFNESKSVNHEEPLSATARFAPGGGPTGTSSPPLRGPGSPLNQSTATNNNNSQGMSSILWK